MGFKLIILCSLLLCELLFAFPATQDSVDEVDPEEIGGYFEGDMDLNEEQMSAILYPNKRNIIRNEMFRWPGNVVLYEFAKVFEDKHKNAIRAAMDTIEQASCVKFIPREPHHQSYLIINGEPSGCHATVGYRNIKPTINLHINEPGKGCFAHGKIIHELFHSLGSYHQHSASNRDDYITIIKENIIKGREPNFVKFPSSHVTDFGASYDYDSIMHYGPNAFSRNGKPTIVPLDKTAKIGQRDHLSEGDLKKLNLMYKCPGY